jgi:hypothetical protein
MIFVCLYRIAPRILDVCVPKTSFH